MKDKIKLGSLVIIQPNRSYFSNNTDNSRGRVIEIDTKEKFTVKVDTKSKGGPSWENIKKLKLINTPNARAKQ